MTELNAYRFYLYLWQEGPDINFLLCCGLGKPRTGIGRDFGDWRQAKYVVRRYWNGFDVGEVREAEAMERIEGGSG